MSAGDKRPTRRSTTARRGRRSATASATTSAAASRRSRRATPAPCPVIVGLILIVGFFYSQNSNYLTAGNFTNLMVQMAGVTTIAIGVVFVLLLGEIDLSIGYVSGIAGVVVAKLQFPDGSWETTGLVAIIIAVIVTALIGLFQGSFVAIIGVPSFVVTLAGLLFWQGVILYSIGDQGVITIDN